MVTKKTTRSKTKPGSAPGATPTAITPEPVADRSGAPAAGPILRKNDFYDRVVAATGAKKGDVRQIADAVLDILGAALSAGEALALPPLGKARVNRQKDLATGEVLIVRLRRGGGGGQDDNGDNEALEEAAE